MNAPQDALLRRASRSMFWNAMLLPLITVLNLIASILIRRHFGLDSGRYDVVIGLVNSWMMYPDLGLSTTISQFAPGLESRHGRPAVAAFLRRVGVLRMALLLLVLVPANLFADVVAEGLQLGEAGGWLVHLTTVLTAIRAANDFVMKSLQALLRHLSANLIQFAQAAAGAAVMITIFATGRSLETVIGALAAVGAALFAIGVGHLVRAVDAIPVRPDGATPTAAATARPAPDFSPGVRRDRFLGFGLFMYLHNWLAYFATPAFASPMIALAAGSAAPVALFNVGVQLPQLSVVLVLAGFQGLYRPLFARLNDEGNAGKLRNAFSEVSKVQAVFLLPAGAGIFVMAGDYIPLMFGAEFAAAVPIAQALSVFMVLEALFNLGTIVLSVDHQYREVVLALALRLAAVPVFVILAARSNLLGAAIVFGTARALSVQTGYYFARRRYGVRFPFAFALRAALPTVAMVAVVGTARTFVATGWPEAVGLTLLGVVTVAIGAKIFGVVGPHELELIERAALPGGSYLVRWLR
jgi:O-antigen/teichoic acid export membrane protein